MKSKILSLALALSLLLCLSACSSEPAGTEENNQNNVADNNTPDEKQDGNTEKATVDAGFLKGPTGIGAAYFMDKAENGELAADYNITIEADPSAVTSALISGDLQIAAVPTNAAATLYNKTEGKVQIAAINTLGVLYILENGTSINSIADLAGKTIYATGQGSNPEYVLNYILLQNGLTPGEDVTIEYMASDELAAQMAAGSLELCMLPVPNATTVLMKNSDVRTALSLTDEWSAIGGGSVLTQGCIVARTDLLDHETITAFLAEYEESIHYMSDEANLDAAAALAVKYEIVGSEEMAKAALPDCNLTYIAGAGDMKATLDGYYKVLFEADPTSIGGTIPDDEFYFGS